MSGGDLQYLFNIPSGFPFYFFGILLLADTNYPWLTNQMKVKQALSNVSLGDAHNRPTNFFVSIFKLTVLFSHLQMA